MNYSANKISISSLSKSFDERVVLKQINLEVPTGSSLVIIGGSGSGKSVLIKCILGLLTPDEGSKILIDDIDYSTTHIKDRAGLAEKVGMLFQGGALFDSLPIWQNIAFYFLNSGQRDHVSLRKLAEEKLKMVDLSPDILDLYPAQLSGGMQKRAALARAIASNPEVLLFDEPTAGLDPINAKIISDLIAGLSKKLQATTITITHDIACMKTVADNIAVLYQGDLIWHGRKHDIFSVTHSYISSFLNAS